MEILLFSNFSKRENSTKAPDITNPSKTVTGYLREPCSIMNPTFKIERFPSDASPQGYNYAYISQFARFYFVKDWAWVDGFWQCQLDVDVLASFKTNIGNSQAYVERSASAYNGAIIDKMYPATTNFSTELIPLASTYYNISPGNGCYVVGIICSANRSTPQLGGAVTYYVMTPAQLNAMMHYLMGSGFLDDNGFTVQPSPLQQLFRDTAKALVNPSQYIVSCTWFPRPASFIGDGVNHPIVLGYYELPDSSNTIVGQYLVVHEYTEIVSGQIPVHPQAPNRGKYLNYSPYTRLSVQIAPFGSIPLDTSFCEIGNYLYCKIHVDTITGKSIMKIELREDAQGLGNYAVVRESSAMFGIPIQLAQMSPDFFGVIGSAISIATKIDSGMNGSLKYNSATFSSGISDIANATDAVMPQVESAGVNGSFLSTIIPPTLTAQFFVVADDDNTEFGRPLCSVRTISTLSGYIKCKDAHVDFPCFEPEKTRILNYMLSGFFWE